MCSPCRPANVRSSRWCRRLRGQGRFRSCDISRPAGTTTRRLPERRRTRGHCGAGATFRNLSQHSPRRAPAFLPADFPDCLPTVTRPGPRPVRPGLQRRCVLPWRSALRRDASAPSARARLSPLCPPLLPFPLELLASPGHLSCSPPVLPQFRCRRCSSVPGNAALSSRDDPAVRPPAPTTTVLFLSARSSSS